MVVSDYPPFYWDPEDISERLRWPAPAGNPLDLHMGEIPEGMVIKEAAVLVPLVKRQQEIHLLFTQRTTHLNAHAGQISFPGGRVEPADQDRGVTALRETEEEIGLPRHKVRVLGHLPEYSIPSGFRITPVIGWIDSPFTTKADPYEVADIFEAPLSHFLDESRYLRHEYHFNGRHRHYVAISYSGRYFWGATAGMLLSLARCLALRNAS